jgi:tripartite-type tricarboxylate transporter receptor subunit TctC
MKLPHRRQFLHLAAGAAALPTMSRLARAQGYPTRPVRLITGFPAGGPTDILARPIGQWLSERLGQPFVIDNRPGAGSNIGTEAVVRAPPDGYTLLLVSPGNAINATLYDKLPFNFIRDIAPVAGIIRVPNVMVVNPSVPAKTVPEFIAYAKTNSGKVNMASSGNGTSPHVAGELFKMMTGINMVHVPYRGSAPAMTDLIAGQVQVYFGTTTASIEYIRTGKLRPLAVTTAARADALPDIPTVGDFVPGYEASGFFGVGAPKATPAEIIEKLNKAINAALADPKIEARLTDLGGTALVGSPADFGKLIAEETEKWRRASQAVSVPGRRRSPRQHGSSPGHQKPENVAEVVAGVRQQCRGIAEKAEDRLHDHEGDVECRSEGEGKPKRFRGVLVQGAGSVEVAVRGVSMPCHA